MSEILTYHWEGDYLIPDLIPPESPHIGIWGERRRQFLRAVKRPIYTGMLFSGTLNAHLEEIDQLPKKCSIGSWLKWPSAKALLSR